MKKLAIAIALLTVAACTPAPDYASMTKGEIIIYAEEQRVRADGNRIGGVVFGAGAVAVCAQTGACAFPL